MRSLHVRSAAVLAALSLALTACATQTPTPEAVPAPTTEVSAPVKTSEPKAKTKKKTPKKDATKLKSNPLQLTWPTPTPPAPEEAVEGTTVFKTAKRVGGIDCSVDKCVALTYDDGPGAYTEKLLKHLRDGNAKATFFMVGRQANARPDVVRKVAAEGHLIANHTWNHPDLRRLSASGQKSEVDSTAKTLRKLSGQSVTMLRPPYGAYNANTRNLGVSLIMWDVDTMDWKTRSTSETVRRALAGVKPGSIILMHDIHAPTVAAAPQLISELKKRGYVLVTVDQLLGSGKAGKVYFSR